MELDIVAPALKILSKSFQCDSERFLGKWNERNAIFPLTAWPLDFGSTSDTFHFPYQQIFHLFYSIYIFHLILHICKWKIVRTASDPTGRWINDSPTIWLLEQIAYPHCCSGSLPFMHRTKCVPGRVVARAFYSYLPFYITIWWPTTGSRTSQFSKWGA